MREGLHYGWEEYFMSYYEHKKQKVFLRKRPGADFIKQDKVVKAVKENLQLVWNLHPS